MLCISPWLAGRNEASDGMMNIQVAIVTESWSAKSSRSPSPPPCTHTRAVTRSFKGSRVNYAHAEATVRCQASAPGGGCSPGCQSPPIKFPAPALMSSAAMCVEYNGAELFACAAARHFMGCRAGAQPGRLGTMTARSSAQPPCGGVIEPKISEPGVGCDDVGRALVPSSSWL